ncbi:MAG: hypothetical protein ACI8T1_003153 [Verrucomicrobiales bacterium]|jgi:hypothetical protein
MKKVVEVSLTWRLLTLRAQLGCCRCGRWLTEAFFHLKQHLFHGERFANNGVWAIAGFCGEAVEIEGIADGNDDGESIKALVDLL